MAQLPYSPPYMYNPGGDRIIDILMRRGDAQAAHSLRSGDIWGNTVRELGGIVGQALQEKQAKQQEEKRNAAIWDALNAPESQDPKVLYKSLFQIAGPKVAQEYTEGIVNLQQLSDKADEANLTRAQKVAGWLAKAPPQLFQQGWPAARAKLAPIAAQLGTELPEEGTPEVQQFLGQVAGMKTPELVKLGTGDVLIDPATGEQRAAGPVAAPKPQSLDAQLAAAYGAGDQGAISGILALKGREAAATRKPEANPGGLSDDVEGYLSGLETGDFGIEGVPAKFKGTVLDEAKKRGLDTRSTKQKDIDSSAEGLITSLQQLDKQAKATMTTESGPGAVVAGSLQAVGAKAGLAPETRKWRAQAAKLAQFARQLGERGTLTDKDIDRIEALVPGLTDNVEIRNTKLKDMRDVIYSSLRGKVSKRVTFPEPSTDDGGTNDEPPE